MTAWEMPAVTLGWADVLRRGGVTHDQFGKFGPCGFMLRVVTDKNEHGSIIVTQADYPEEEGVDWLHVSLAYATRPPTYAELVLLHRAMFGRHRYAYQVFAPDSFHVNVHPNALHLWGRVDGRPELPMAPLVASLGSV